MAMSTIPRALDFVFEYEEDNDDYVKDDPNTLFERKRKAEMELNKDNWTTAFCCLEHRPQPDKSAAPSTTTMTRHRLFQVADDPVLQTRRMVRVQRGIPEERELPVGVARFRYGIYGYVAFLLIVIWVAVDTFIHNQCQMIRSEVCSVFEC